MSNPDPKPKTPANREAGGDCPSAPCSADLIQRAWEKYHGLIIDEGGEEYIPAMPPAFMRGFVDGYEQGKKSEAIVTILKLVEPIMEAWSKSHVLDEWHCRVEDLLGTAYPSFLDLPNATADQTSDSEFGQACDCDQGYRKMRDPDSRVVHWERCTKCNDTTDGTEWFGGVEPGEDVDSEIVRNACQAGKSETVNGRLRDAIEGNDVAGGSEEGVCRKCGDKLQGHEDESGTLCRWCVTGWVQKTTTDISVAACPHTLNVLVGQDWEG